MRSRFNNMLSIFILFFAVFQFSCSGSENLFADDYGQEIEDMDTKADGTTKPLGTYVYTSPLGLSNDEASLDQETTTITFTSDKKFRIEYKRAQEEPLVVRGTCRYTTSGDTRYVRLYYADPGKTGTEEVARYAYTLLENTLKLREVGQEQWDAFEKSDVGSCDLRQDCENQGLALPYEDGNWVCHQTTCQHDSNEYLGQTCKEGICEAPEGWDPADHIEEAFSWAKDQMGQMVDILNRDLFFLGFYTRAEQPMKLGDWSVNDLDWIFEFFSPTEYFNPKHGYPGVYAIVKTDRSSGGELFVDAWEDGYSEETHDLMTLDEIKEDLNMGVNDAISIFKGIAENTEENVEIDLIRFYRNVKNGELIFQFVNTTTGESYDLNVFQYQS